MASGKTIIMAFGVLLAGAAYAQAPSSTEQRVQELDKRLRALEAKKTPTVASLGDARRTGASSAFNPAISLILDGRYSRFSEKPDTYAIPGFALGEETGPGEEGLSLGESELVISANVDDKFSGSLTAALTPENEVEVEEAFIETLALGGGFTAKAGRFFSHIGYLNPVHGHAWDFADQPLVYRALLANQFGDDGIQLRWVAPLDLFVEVGAELFRGDGFPAAGAANDGRGAQGLFLHVGGDVGPLDGGLLAPLEIIGGYYHRVGVSWKGGTTLRRTMPMEVESR